MLLLTLAAMIVSVVSSGLVTHAYLNAKKDDERSKFAAMDTCRMLLPITFMFACITIIYVGLRIQGPYSIKQLLELLIPYQRNIALAAAILTIPFITIIIRPPRIPITTTFTHGDEHGRIPYATAVQYNVFAHIILASLWTLIVAFIYLYGTRGTHISTPGNSTIAITAK